MAKAGRKPHTIPPVTWKCQVPTDVAAKVDLLLQDPLRGVPVYGARSALVTQLLRNWLAQFEQAASPEPEKVLG